MDRPRCRRESLSNSRGIAPLRRDKSLSIEILINMEWTFSVPTVNLSKTPKRGKLGLRAVAEKSTNRQMRIHLTVITMKVWSSSKIAAHSNHRTFLTQMIGRSYSRGRARIINLKGSAKIQTLSPRKWDIILAPLHHKNKLILTKRCKFRREMAPTMAKSNHRSPTSKTLRARPSRHSHLRADLCLRGGSKLFRTV